MTGRGNNGTNQTLNPFSHRVSRTRTRTRTLLRAPRYIPANDITSASLRQQHPRRTLSVHAPAPSARTYLTRCTPANTPHSRPPPKLSLCSSTSVRCVLRPVRTPPRPPCTPLRPYFAFHIRERPRPQTHITTHDIASRAPPPPALAPRAHWNASNDLCEMHIVFVFVRLRLPVAARTRGADARAGRGGSGTIRTVPYNAALSRIPERAAAHHIAPMHRSATDAPLRPERAIVHGSYLQYITVLGHARSGTTADRKSSDIRSMNRRVLIPRAQERSAGWVQTSFHHNVSVLVKYLGQRKSSQEPHPRWKDAATDGGDGGDELGHGVWRQQDGGNGYVSDSDATDIGGVLFCCESDRGGFAMTKANRSAEDSGEERRTHL
ncbi:hypothetical protein B0H17DRAFT_1209982 [Mycena rosella]|uniref:Uncharacterized protein n=1 Tax=Mycena rosella TaxID=1033263 RepID=A0AAD7G7W5_MYCRO|nr:hypothetical protein B0H17DRAFT_1209982 [Mycena rosella]